MIDQKIKQILEDTGHKSPKAAETRGEPTPEFLSEILAEEPLVALPNPHSLDYSGKDLRKSIEERRTLRRLDPADPISLDELSISLWLTQGVIKVDDKRQDTLRNVPGAGRRHAFETFLGIRNVPGLEPGLYHYIAQEHALQKIIASDSIVDQVAEAAYKQKQMLNAPVIFIWVAYTERMTWRYSLRGLRYLFLDAGHICQNLYLAAELYNGAVCAIGAYDDQAINALLELDGSNRFVAYMASLGRKTPEA